MTAFFFYKVYILNERRIDPPQSERSREAQYLDDERSVKRPTGA
jgi:hypothetical protein